MESYRPNHQVSDFIDDLSEQSRILYMTNVELHDHINKLLEERHVVLSQRAIDELAYGRKFRSAREWIEYTQATRGEPSGQRYEVTVRSGNRWEPAQYTQTREHHIASTQEPVLLNNGTFEYEEIRPYRGSAHTYGSHIERACQVKNAVEDAMYQHGYDFRLRSEANVTMPMNVGNHIGDLYIRSSHPDMFTSDELHTASENRSHQTSDTGDSNSSTQSPEYSGVHQTPPSDMVSANFATDQSFRPAAFALSSILDGVGKPPSNRRSLPSRYERELQLAGVLSDNRLWQQESLSVQEDKDASWMFGATVEYKHEAPLITDDEAPWVAKLVDE